MDENENQIITTLHIPEELIIDPDRLKLEKRKPDGVVVTLQVITVLASLGFITSVLFFFRAKPVGANFFNQIISAGVKSFWNTELITQAMIIMAVSIVLSAISLIMRLVKKPRMSAIVIYQIIISASSIALMILYTYVS